jgi:hypothetical protein
MPYICLARTDIPDGQVQILDLKPNSSNRNLIYEPEGQTKYVNRASNDRVVGSGTAGETALDANGLRAYLADRFDPTNLGGSVWTAGALTTGADALLAEVDAGNALTAADVTTALTAALGAAVGYGVGGSVTAADSQELLNVLAGRGYLLPAGSVKMAGAAWDAVQRGAFTTDVLHFGTTWNSGEIRPAAIGGDTVAVETKPIKHTYDGTHFQISLGTGHLLNFAAGVTLFPDSDLVPHHPSQYQGINNFPEATNARVVTVYDDDGSLLA